MATPQKDLKKEAAKFLSLRDLFPKSKLDLRRNLTKYQEKKIKQAVAEVKQYGGGKVNQFVPMGRGRKKYMEDSGLPPWLKGVFLPGGEKVNKKLEYAGKEIRYTRGGAPRSRTELDTSGDETDLIASAKNILKDRNNRTAAITANGFVISGAQNLHRNDLIIKEAVFIFNKYSQMFDAGEYREGQYKNTLAAHPSDWGMGILFERGRSKADKNKARAKYSKAWKKFHGGKK